MVEGDEFEPSKAVPADLQSAPFGHSGTLCGCVLLFYKSKPGCSMFSHKPINQVVLLTLKEAVTMVEGDDSNHRRRSRRFTVCPLWPLGNLQCFS